MASIWMYRTENLKILLFVAGILAWIMFVTRSPNASTELHLQDASLAVFFVAGFYLRSWSWIVLFLFEAALIDYLAINLTGINGWIAPAAYVFLLPTYAVMWFAGRWLSCGVDSIWVSCVKVMLVAPMSVAVAFFISNGSYYLLSGYFDVLSWQQYAEKSLVYFGWYMKASLGYIAIAFIIHFTLVALIRPISLKPISLN